MSCYEDIDIRNLAIKAFCEIQCSEEDAFDHCPYNHLCTDYERFNERLFDLVQNYRIKKGDIKPEEP